MTVTKTNISSNLPTTSQVITVASGEKVLAETENANNSLLISALILAYNWIIDSGVQLSDANTFSGTQTFGTIKAAYLESLTGSSDVVLRNGTFKYGGTTSGDEVANKAYVLAQIAAAATVVGAAMTGANGSVAGTAGAAPAPAATDNVNFLRGDATWAAITGFTAKTSNFTTAAGGKYRCSSGVTSVALHTPTGGDEFWIKPDISNSLGTNPIAFTGTPQIAGAASTAYSANENVIYHFVANGTNYDVSAEVIAR